MTSFESSSKASEFSPLSKNLKKIIQSLDNIEIDLKLVNSHVALISQSKDHLLLERFPRRKYMTGVIFMLFGILGYLFIPTSPIPEFENLDIQPIFETFAKIPLVYQAARPFSWVKLCFLLVWFFAGLLQPEPTEGVFLSKSGKCFLYSYFPYPIYSIIHFSNRLFLILKGKPSDILYHHYENLPKQLDYLPYNARIYSFNHKDVKNVFSSSYDEHGTAWRVVFRVHNCDLHLTAFAINDLSLTGESCFHSAELIRRFLNLKVDPYNDDYILHCENYLLQEQDDFERKNSKKTSVLSKKVE